MCSRRTETIKIKVQITGDSIGDSGRNLETVKKEGYTNIWIKKDLNEEEQAKIYERWDETKEKKESRTEREFY